MYHLRCMYTIAWIAVIGGCSIARADLFPVLENDEEIISYLIFISKQYPLFFRLAATYDSDVFKIINTLQTLQVKLPKLHGYDWVKHYHSKLRVIHIQLEVEKEVKHYIIDPKVIESWKSDLNSLLDPIEVEEGGLQTYLEEKIIMIQRLPIQPLSNALIKILDSDNTKNLLKKSLSEKLKYIEFSLKESSQHLLSVSFKHKAFRLSPVKEEGKDPVFLGNQVWNILNEWIELKQSLAHYIEIYALLKGESEFPSSIEAAQKRISTITETDLDIYFHGVGEIKNDLLLKRLSSLKKLKKGAQRVRTHLKKITSAKQEIITSVGGEIWLLQSSKDKAPFRGFIASDCQTSHSMPLFVIDPVFEIYDEKVFLLPGGQVVNAEGQIIKSRGAVTLALGKVNQKVTAYVHTVNGSHVSPKHINLIREGLFNAWSKMDMGSSVSELSSISSLGTRARVFSNMNYDALRQVFYQDIQKGELVDFEFMFKEIREHLNSKISSTYDTPASNKQVVLYTPQYQSDINTDVSFIEIPKFENNPASQIRKLALALDLRFSKRDRLVNRVQRTTQISQKEFNEIIETLSNKKNLIVEEYYKSVSSKLKPFQIVLDQHFMKKHGYLLWNGSFKSPNILSEQHLEEGMSGAVAMLKLETNPDNVMKLVEKNPKIFMENKKFQKYMISLCSDATEDRLQLQKLISYGVHGSWINKGILNYLEMLDEVSSSSIPARFVEFLNKVIYPDPMFRTQFIEYVQKKSIRTLGHSISALGNIEQTWGFDTGSDSKGVQTLFEIVEYGLEKQRADADREIRKIFEKKSAQVYQAIQSDLDLQFKLISFAQESDKLGSLLFLDHASSQRPDIEEKLHAVLVSEFEKGAQTGRLEYLVEQKFSTDKLNRAFLSYLKSEEGYITTDDEPSFIYSFIEFDDEVRAQVVSNLKKEDVRSSFFEFNLDLFYLTESQYLQRINVDQEIGDATAFRELLNLYSRLRWSPKKHKELMNKIVEIFNELSKNYAEIISRYLILDPDLYASFEMFSMREPTYGAYALLNELRTNNYFSYPIPEGQVSPHVSIDRSFDYYEKKAISMASRILLSKDSSVEDKVKIIEEISNKYTENTQIHQALFLASGSKHEQVREAIHKALETQKTSIDKTQSFIQNFVLTEFKSLSNQRSWHARLMISHLAPTSDLKIHQKLSDMLTKYHSDSTMKILSEAFSRQPVMDDEIMNQLVVRSNETQELVLYRAMAHSGKWNLKVIKLLLRKLNRIWYSYYGEQISQSNHIFELESHMWVLDKKFENILEALKKILTHYSGAGDRESEEEILKYFLSNLVSSKKIWDRRDACVFYELIMNLKNTNKNLELAIQKILKSPDVFNKLQYMMATLEEYGDVVPKLMAFSGHVNSIHTQLKFVELAQKHNSEKYLRVISYLNQPMNLEVEGALLEVLKTDKYNAVGYEVRKQAVNLLHAHKKYSKSLFQFILKDLEYTSEKQDMGELKEEQVTGFKDAILRVLHDISENLKENLPNSSLVYSYQKCLAFIVCRDIGLKEYEILLTTGPMSIEAKSYLFTHYHNPQKIHLERSRILSEVDMSDMHILLSGILNIDWKTRQSDLEETVDHIIAKGWGNLFWKTLNQGIQNTTSQKRINAYAFMFNFLTKAQKLPTEGDLPWTQELTRLSILKKGLLDNDRSIQIMAQNQVREFVLSDSKKLIDRLNLSMMHFTNSAGVDSILGLHRDGSLNLLPDIIKNDLWRVYLTALGSRDERVRSVALEAFATLKHPVMSDDDVNMFYSRGMNDESNGVRLSALKGYATYLNKQNSDFIQFTTMEKLMSKVQAELVDSKYATSLTDVSHNLKGWVFSKKSPFNTWNRINKQMNQIIFKLAKHELKEVQIAVLNTAKNHSDLWNHRTIRHLRKHLMCVR